MWKIKEVFDEMHEPWGITFPAEDLASRAAGEILEQGWMILYQFAEEEGAAYLDVYETHRMTSDGHLRIFETGSVGYLPAMQDMLLFPLEATDDEIDQIREEFVRSNAAVRRMWSEKWEAQYDRAVRRVEEIVRQLSDPEE